MTITHVPTYMVTWGGICTRIGGKYESFKIRLVASPLAFGDYVSKCSVSIFLEKHNFVGSAVNEILDKQTDIVLFCIIDICI